jgi:hypothetical protein
MRYDVNPDLFCNAEWFPTLYYSVLKGNLEEFNFSSSAIVIIEVKKSGI